MTRSRSTVALVACCTAWGTLAAAQTTLYVNDACGNDAWTGLSAACESPNGPKQTIRAAIAASAHDDTIIVADGIYAGVGNRGINFGGRRILLRSENGPEHCIIDAGGIASAFFMADNLTPESIIDGFTIRNGQSSEGGAFWFHHSNRATIRNCIITGNSATRGGAVFTRIDSAPTFINCAFIGNSAVQGGAFAAVHESSPTLINCIFYGNTASDDGGAFYSDGIAAPTLINTTIANNTALQRIGAIHLVSGNLTLRNSIVWANHAPALSPITVGATTLTAAANLTIGHSLIEGGEEGILVQGAGMLNWLAGNLSADPLLVDPAAANMRLGAGSPAIDAGDNTALPLNILADLDGNPRFVDDPATPATGIPGGAGGKAIVDMGAYEFQALECYANCDGSTTKPILTVDDFTCFINAFAEASALPHEQQLTHYANCDGSTTPPVLTVDDFTCFIDAFAQGCP